MLVSAGLLGVKRDEISTLQQRYATGLEKLDFAASQVLILKCMLVKERVVIFTNTNE